VVWKHFKTFTLIWELQAWTNCLSLKFDGSVNTDLKHLRSIWVFKLLAAVRKSALKNNRNFLITFLQQQCAVSRSDIVIPNNNPGQKPLSSDSRTFGQDWRKVLRFASQCNQRWIVTAIKMTTEKNKCSTYTVIELEDRQFLQLRIKCNTCL